MKRPQGKKHYLFIGNRCQKYSIFIGQKRCEKLVGSKKRNVFKSRYGFFESHSTYSISRACRSFSKLIWNTPYSIWCTLDFVCIERKPAEQTISLFCPAIIRNFKTVFSRLHTFVRIMNGVRSPLQSRPLRESSIILLSIPSGSKSISS